MAKISSNVKTGTAEIMNVIDTFENDLMERLEDVFSEASLTEKQDLRRKIADRLTKKAQSILNFNGGTRY